MSITIRKKDNGIQAIVNYKVNGVWKQKAKQKFKTEKEARKWAENVELDIKIDIRDHIDPSNITIDDIRTEFLDSLLLEGRKENTYLTYKNTLKVLDEMKDKKAIDLTPNDLKKFFLELREKTGFSYHHHYQVTRIMFNFAINELRVLRYNPCGKRLANVHEDTREHYISKALYKDILDSLSNPTEKIFLRLLHETGIRKSEALGITNKDITKFYVDINKQYNRGKFKPPKTENGYRKLAISKSLYRDLRSIPVKLDGRLFPKMVCLDQKLSKFDVSPHCFRYTFGTDLVAIGINLKAAADLMGDSFEIFIKTYVKKNPEATQLALDTIRKQKLS